MTTPTNNNPQYSAPYSPGRGNVTNNIFFGGGAPGFGSGSVEGSKNVGIEARRYQKMTTGYGFRGFYEQRSQLGGINSNFDWRDTKTPKIERGMGPLKTPVAYRAGKNVVGKVQNWWGGKQADVEEGKRITAEGLPFRGDPTEGAKAPGTQFPDVGLPGWLPSASTGGPVEPGHGFSVYPQPQRQDFTGTDINNQQPLPWHSSASDASSWSFT